MFKKILSAGIVAGMLLSLASCTPNLLSKKSSDASSAQSLGSTGPVHTKSKNPLTGLYDLEKGSENSRPVGIMINNIKQAWSVQTGVEKADIVYETLAEGGITRFLAIYKDISKAPTIGTVRSARYSYGELAVSHDALLVHCGMDEKYARSHFKSIGVENYDFMYKDAACFRIQNGKAYEHTLYTSGEKLYSALSKSNVRLKVNSNKAGSWLSFNEPETVRVPADGPCSKIVVPFSEYISYFEYDSAKGVYLKGQGGLPQKDFRSGNQISVTNVFVVFTEITEFYDKEHVKEDLSSGTGYYLTAGGYQKINWKKGDASNVMSFTDINGQPLKCNAGKSWICITDQSNEAKVTIS